MLFKNERNGHSTRTSWLSRYFLFYRMKRCEATIVSLVPWEIVVVLVVSRRTNYNGSHEVSPNTVQETVWQFVNIGYPESYICSPLATNTLLAWLTRTIVNDPELFSEMMKCTRARVPWGIRKRGKKTRPISLRLAKLTLLSPLLVHEHSYKIPRNYWFHLSHPTNRTYKPNHQQRSIGEEKANNLVK